MKKRLIQTLVKKAKNIHVFVPNDIRLSFYISPLGDVSNKMSFTKEQLADIQFWEEKNVVNVDLFEGGSALEEGNILALLEEGTIKDVPTGADTGIYDYPTIQPNPKSQFDYTKYLNGKVTLIDSEDVSVNYRDTDKDSDYFLRNCILAESNPLGGEATKVLFTFKGYLEVTKGEFSIIRNFDSDKCDIDGVHIPQEYVYKYQLRHGDEIVCTCKEDNGKMLIGSLFSINQIPRRLWNISRPWFNRLKPIKAQALKCESEYMNAIINKFKLFAGDNTFAYLTKTTQKQQVLTKLIQELNAVFDKIIYINPNYKSMSLDVGGYNVSKFTTLFTSDFNNKITNILLASQYSRRLIEMGKKVAILIDDIDALNELNNKYNQESSILKTVYGAVKVCETGYCSSFSLVSLRGNNINSVNLPALCKSVETLGILIDNNETDLFNSYRI